MNDNPTPKEIEAFEKANPGLAALKEINQWWLRSGLIALAVWAGVFWLWLKRTVIKKPFVLIFLMGISGAFQLLGINSSVTIKKGGSVIIKKSPTGVMIKHP